MKKAEFLQPTPENVLLMQVQVVGEDGKAYYVCDCTGMNYYSIWQSLVNSEWYKNTKLQLVDEYGRICKTHNMMVEDSLVND